MFPTLWSRAPRSGYRCNVWFVQGRSRSLLVDTGSGLVSLREQVACLAERPVLAVATHRHFDHIGSHHEFVERAAHPSEARHLAEPDREAILIEPYATSSFPNLGVDQSDGGESEADDAEPVALVRDLDLDHLGPKQTELVGAVGPRQDLGEIDDTDPVERTHDILLVPVRESEVLDLSKLQWRELDDAGMITHDLTPDEVGQALALKERHPALSANDCFCFVTPLAHPGILLTGDALPRRVATDNGLRVHGVLWVIDELDATGTCARSLLTQALMV